jgi:hypothetical protein
MKTWLIQIIRVSIVVVSLPLLELTLIPKVRAFIIPTHPMIGMKQSEPKALSTLADTNNNNMLDTTPTTTVERTSGDVRTNFVPSETSTTMNSAISQTTAIQVCGSKDCTRRGGGARLEKQIRQVMCLETYFHCCCSVIDIYTLCLLTLMIF